MNLLIAGATGGLGRALSIEAAARGDNTLLAASDGRDLAALRQHLVLSYGVAADYVVCDFADPAAAGAITAAVSRFGPIDGVLFPIGFARDDDDGALPSPEVRGIANINFITQVCVVSALWEHLKARPAACVVGFGSIAAIRGRRKNIVYAAAKRALGSYFESLMHAAVGTSVHVCFFQLGYLDTPQTFGKRLLLPKASPTAVARVALDRVKTGSSWEYYPGYWRYVAWVLRGLPWALHRRMNF